MNKFIELQILHNDNKDYDTKAAISIDGIALVSKATVYEKKQRVTIQSLVHMKSGQVFSVNNCYEDIVEELKAASL